MSYKKITNTATSLQWIDIVDPTKEDKEKIEAEFSVVTTRDVSDSVRKTFRSKIVKREHYLYLVIMVPLYSAKKRSIEIEEIDFFINKHFLIVVHQGTIPSFSELFGKCEKNEGLRKRMVEQGVENLLYELIRSIVENTYPIIDDVNIELEQLKAAIFKGRNTKNVVKESLAVRRNITDMRRAIRGHASVLRHMIKHEKHSQIIDIKHNAQFEELVDYANEIWGALESDKEMIEALEDANEATISHNLNETIRTLTAFSAILLPGAVIAGIFGMNMQHTPIIGHPLDFWIVMAIIAVISISLFFIFWKKHWVR